MTSDFASLGLSSELLEVVRDYPKTTPVQAQAIPALLSGRDLIAQSRTGSGKTLAFALPLLEKVDTRQREIQALVLCPTRELCTQVAREIRRLGRHHRGLQVLIVSGGLPPKPQALSLAKGVHVVVGTPGRLLDHLNRGRMDLSRVRLLVLDEADRMLDMGFEEEMEAILEEVPGTRQTAFFSATYPKDFKALSERHQHEPVSIKIEDDSRTTIEHLFSVVEAEHKVQALIRQLQVQRPESAFVFCNLKVTVSELAKVLGQKGFSSDALHGDLEQVERDRVMAKFRNGSTRILVATDVAARGLDIENVPMVVCFDLPHQPEDYVHRVGRTGRAGRQGLALSLVTPQEMIRLNEIEQETGFQLRPLSSNEERAKTPDTLPRLAAMETLYISGGRREKIRPGDILGALTGEAGGLQGADIGKIEIHDHFSYVAVSTRVAAQALQRLNAGRIKGRKFLVKSVH